MTVKRIEELLYPLSLNYVLEESNGIAKLIISGEVWIGQIQKLLKPQGWEYSKGKAIFYIKV